MTSLYENIKSKLPFKCEMPLDTSDLVFYKHNFKKGDIKQMLVLMITLGFVVQNSAVCLIDQNKAWDLICELLERLALSLIIFYLSYTIVEWRYSKNPEFPKHPIFLYLCTIISSDQNIVGNEAIMK